jgi:hypothetical protein
VGVHGYVRATDDLDFISRQPLGVTRARLRKAGVETRLVRGDLLDRGFSSLKGEIDEIPFDVLPPLVPIVWERALALDIAGGTLKVVDLDALLQLKFRAGGPQDLLDAARLVLSHPEAETRARELATAYRARDRFDAWLRDRRILAQAREEAQRRKVRSATPAGRRVKSGRGRRRARRPRGPRSR